MRRNQDTAEHKTGMGMKSMPMFYHMNPDNFYARWSDVEFGMIGGEPKTPNRWTDPQVELDWFMLQREFLASILERIDTYVAAIQRQRSTDFSAPQNTTEGESPAK